MMLTTPHLDSYSTTDLKPEILSAVKTVNSISRDKRNVWGIDVIMSWIMKSWDKTYDTITYHLMTYDNMTYNVMSYDVKTYNIMTYDI